jgi:selenocysteine-specific elongation factor
MIVTLAGHVDHGKTTLVRLLTGTDTDRLAEERRRGLTIDLGFAYLQHDGGVIGFVDVPGHHRFIHNMVAGVAALQHALLVIAADDGPMPQSREHLQILDLIGIRRGLIALTKCDRVTPERRAAARREIEALVAGTFLQGCPIIETSAETGEGLAALRATLIDAAATIDQAPADRPFRMAVDRAFTLKGTGVVVTGTVYAGEVGVDQEIHHFPSGRRARVRGLRVQNQPAAIARPGDRAALNLVGLEVSELGRGDWVASHPETGHRHLVIDLSVLDDFSRSIRQWLPVHVYHATRHSTGRLALFGGAGLPPGAAGWAELDCDEPLFAKRGDRLVIRDQGLDRTLGGGTVLDNRPRPRRRRAPARIASIAAYQQPTPAQSLAALLALGALDTREFQQVWHLPLASQEALIQATPATLHDHHLVLDSLWADWSAALLAECETRHAEDPGLQGLQENAFGNQVPERFRGDVLRELVAAGKLEQRAGRYRPLRHQVRLAPNEAAIFERLQPLLAQPQPMSLGDIAKDLKIPLINLQKLVRQLAIKGAVTQVNDKRVYLPDQVRALAETAMRLSSQGPFTARDFRDAAAIGRNIAIDVLEFFDARGFTRRNGDTRIVATDLSRLFTS